MVNCRECFLISEDDVAFVSLYWYIKSQELIADVFAYYVLMDIIDIDAVYIIQKRTKQIKWSILKTFKYLGMTEYWASVDCLICIDGNCLYTLFRSVGMIITDF